MGLGSLTRERSTLKKGHGRSKLWAGEVGIQSPALSSMVDLLVVKDTISHEFELDQGRRGRFPFVRVVSVSAWAITSPLIRWRRGNN